jgi:hypothetical protein
MMHLKPNACTRPGRPDARMLKPNRDTESVANEKSAVSTNIFKVLTNNRSNDHVCHMPLIQARYSHPAAFVEIFHGTMILNLNSNLSQYMKSSSQKDDSQSLCLQPQIAFHLPAQCKCDIISISVTESMAKKNSKPSLNEWENFWYTFHSSENSFLSYIRFCLNVSHMRIRCFAIAGAGPRMKSVPLQ